MSDEQKLERYYSMYCEDMLTFEQWEQIKEDFRDTEV